MRKDTTHRKQQCTNWDGYGSTIYTSLVLDVEDLLSCVLSSWPRAKLDSAHHSCRTATVLTFHPTAWWFVYTSKETVNIPLLKHKIKKSRENALYSLELGQWKVACGEIDKRRHYRSIALWHAQFVFSAIRADMREHYLMEHMQGKDGMCSVSRSRGLSSWLLS